MADQIINIPGVGPVNFPDSMADADIQKAIPNIISQHAEENRKASKVAFEANAPESHLGMNMSAGTLWDELTNRAGINPALAHPLNWASSIGSSPPMGSSLQDMAANAKLGIMPLAPGPTGIAAPPPGFGMARALMDPSSLEARAAANRATVQPAASVAEDAITSLSPKVGLVRALSKPYRAVAAPIQEKLAQLLSTYDKPAAMNLPGTVISNPVTPPQSMVDALRREQSFQNTPRIGLDARGAPLPSQPIEPTPGVQSIANALTRENIPQLDMRPQAGPSQPIEAGPAAQIANALTRDNIPQLDMRPPSSPSQPITMENPPVPTPAVPPPSEAPALNRWMDVQPKQMMHGADPAKQILNEGLLGADKQATLGNVQAALADAGQQMEAHLQAAKGVTIDAQTPVYNALNSAIKKIGAPKDSAFTSQINGILDDIETKYPDLSRLPPTQVHALKVELGDAIKWSGTASEEPANQAMMQIYSDLNQAIKDKVPGISETQNRWASLYQGAKALKVSLVKDAAGRGTGSIMAKTLAGGR
jgi:hypothetical protein